MQFAREAYQLTKIKRTYKANKVVPREEDAKSPNSGGKMITFGVSLNSERKHG